jgi:hypothetical protein
METVFYFPFIRVPHKALSDSIAAPRMICMALYDGNHGTFGSPPTVRSAESQWFRNRSWAVRADVPRAAPMVSQESPFARAALTAAASSASAFAAAVQAAVIRRKSAAPLSTCGVGFSRRSVPSTRSGAARRSTCRT